MIKRIINWARGHGKKTVIDFDGVMIKLDPAKKYIFVLDPTKVSRYAVEAIFRGQMQNGGIYCIRLDGFKIIENSDSITGFVIDKEGGDHGDTKQG